MMQVKLDQYPMPKEEIDFVDYYKGWYGIDVNKLSPEMQKLLALFKHAGASQAVSMILQEIQEKQSIEDNLSES